jgi:hypothetical protein
VNAQICPPCAAIANGCHSLQVARRLVFFGLELVSKPVERSVADDRAAEAEEREVEGVVAFPADP